MPGRHPGRLFVGSAFGSSPRGQWPAQERRPFSLGAPSFRGGSSCSHLQAHRLQPRLPSCDQGAATAPLPKASGGLLPGDSLPRPVALLPA